MRVFFYFLTFYFIKISLTELKIPQYSNSTQLDTCISKILKNVPNIFTVRVSSNHNSSIDENYLIINGINNLLKKTEIAEIYILSFRDNDSLLFWFTHMYILKTWDSSGKYIIFVEKPGDRNEIMKILWKYYIINVIVLLTESKTYKGYTFYPYNMNNCEINITSKYIFSCHKKIPKNIFPCKVKNNLNGCSVKILAMHYPPLVANTSIIGDDASKVGIETAIMNAFATKMNFTPFYVTHNYTIYGFIYSNGSYTGVFVEVQNGNVDFLFGHLADSRTASSARFGVIQQVLIFHDTWYVPIAREKLRWSSLINVFCPFLWISLITSVILFGIIWWIFQKIQFFLQTKQKVSTTRGILSNIEFAYKILLQVSVKLSSTTNERIIIMCWILYCMVISTAYQSKLISILTQPQMDHQISTIEELLKSDLKIGSTEIMQEYMGNDPIYNNIWDRFVLCPFNEKCLNRTAFQRDIAVMKTDIYSEYITKRIYLDAKGRSLIYPLQNFIAWSSLPSFLTRKGYPLGDKLKDFILRVHSNGLISKWLKDISSKEREIKITELSPLFVLDELCAFLILFLGLSLSLVVFVIEIAYVRVQKFFQSKKYLKNNV